MKQAMILAAGLGTRLWPLTADRAKPAVPFFGKPLVAGIVELIASHGFSRCVVNTHHRPESIRAALVDAPIEVAFSHEEEILGTAGCLKKALSEGLLRADFHTLVVNGKLVTDIDPTAVLDHHFAREAAVTMVLKPNPAREHFREVRVSEEGTVVGFGAGRIPEGPSPLLFTGIHVLAPEVLARIPSGESDTIRDIYPAFIDAGRAHAFVDRNGAWAEFSTLARYLDLHGDAVALSPGARIEPSATVERAVLWEDAVIETGATVKRSILGKGVRVRSGEVVEESVLVDLDVAGEDPRGEVLGDRLRVPIVSGGSP